MKQLNLNLDVAPEPSPVRSGHCWCSFADDLARFDEFGRTTVVETTVCTGPDGGEVRVPTYLNEYWTARQRQASSLHEISYRACFKPQLPRFFIERLTVPGDRVYDPFMGRGTTLLEAALLGRVPWGNDANPLSKVLIAPRLTPPSLSQVAERLAAVDWRNGSAEPEDLLVFYHPDTLRQINALRTALLARETAQQADAVDRWITMVAVNRLTGHSPGFFSAYTLPPNQATSVQAQRRINEKRRQTPPARDVPALILRKSRQLLGDCDARVREQLAKLAPGVRLLAGPASATADIPSNSVALVVTSPPFLNVVQYSTDNWLRCWFLGFDAKSVPLTTPSNLDRWREVMTKVFVELLRVLRPGGHVAFEVGEVSRGTVQLESAVVPCALAAGFQALLILVNAQQFTKTANCWGVDNNTKGTNTNRIVLLRKPPV